MFFIWPSDLTRIIIKLLYYIFIIVTHPYDVIILVFIKNAFCKNKTSYPRSEFDIHTKQGLASILYQTVMLIFTPVTLILYPFLRLSAFGESIRQPTRSTSSGEKWFFINGIITDYWSLDANCENIETRFNVGVTGIYNWSYGLIWDLVESVLQRDFGMHNAAVHKAREMVLRELRNGRTVKLLAHSQGAIIANLVIMYVYTVLSKSGEKDYLKNLEVYTFANASTRFKNPENLIKIMEHYANNRDPICRIGILSHFDEFDGSIFVNGSESGHLFNKFYSLKRQDYKISNTPTAVLL